MITRELIWDKYQLIRVSWVASDVTIWDTDVTKFNFYLPKKTGMDTAFQNKSVIYYQTMVQQKFNFHRVMSIGRSVNFFPKLTGHDNLRSVSCEISEKWYFCPTSGSFTPMTIGQLSPMPNWNQTVLSTLPRMSWIQSKSTFFTTSLPFRDWRPLLIYNIYIQVT